MSSSSSSSSEDLTDFEDLVGDGGVRKRITRAAKETSRVPKKGETVFAHYKGYILSSGKVFDDSRSKPHRKDIGFYFALGEHGVIDGWEIGFASMKIGEQATLRIEPKYGYGYGGMPGAGIKGGDVLCFDVELLDAKFLSDEERRALDEKVRRLRRQ